MMKKWDRVKGECRFGEIPPSKTPLIWGVSYRKKKLTRITISMKNLHKVGTLCKVEFTTIRLLLLLLRDFELDENSAPKGNPSLIEMSL
jgi:hypothetical protein